MMSRFAAPADSCRHGATVLALLVCVNSAGAVSAQSDPVELSWDSPAGCPPADAVRARVRAIAGRVSAATPPLQAAATITQRADGSFQLRLFVQKQGMVAERELVARSCSDLAGAAAVNLALLLEDPAPLTAAAPSPSPSPSPASDMTPSPEETANGQQASVARALEQDAPRAPDAGSGVRVLIQAPSVALALGPLPSPSLGFSLAASAWLDSWLISAGSTIWLAHAATSTRPETSAELDRLSASVRVCRDFALGGIGLAPCLSVSAEHLRASGTGPYVRAANASATWLAAGAGVQVRYLLTPWLNVLCGADLKLQTARPRVSIEGIGPLAELGWLAAELSLGGEWIL